MAFGKFHIFNRTKDTKPLNALLSPKASEQKEAKELLTTEQLKSQANSDSPGGTSIQNRIDYFKFVLKLKGCDASVRIAFLQKKHLSVLLENIQKLSDEDENKLVYLCEIDKIIRDFIQCCETSEEVVALVKNGLILLKHADYVSLKSCIETLKNIEPKKKAVKFLEKFLVQLIETPQRLSEEFLQMILGFAPDICKNEDIKNKLLALDPLPACVLQYVIKSLTTAEEIEKFIDTIYKTTESTQIVPYNFIETHYINLLHRCLKKHQFDRVCGFMLKQSILMTEGLNEALLICLRKEEWGFATVQVAEKIVQLKNVSDAVLTFLRKNATIEKSVAAIFRAGPNQVKIAASHLTEENNDDENEEKQPKELKDKMTVAAASVQGLPPEAAQTLPVHFSLLDEDKDRAKFLSNALGQENLSPEQRTKLIPAISSQKHVRDILRFIHEDAEGRDEYCNALLKHLHQPWFDEKLIQDLLETKNLSNELLIAIAKQSSYFKEQKTMDLLVLYPTLDIFQIINPNSRDDLIRIVLRNRELQSKTLLKCIERINNSEHFDRLWDERFIFNTEDQHLQALVQKTCGSKNPAEEKRELEEKAAGNPVPFELTDVQKNELLAHKHMKLGLARMVLAPDSNNVNVNNWVQHPETLARLALIKDLDGQDIEDILNHSKMTVKIAKENFFRKKNYRGHEVHFKIASNPDIFCYAMEKVHTNVRFPNLVENWITETRAACDASVNAINRKIAKKQPIELDKAILTTILAGTKAKYCEHFLKDLKQKNKHPKKAAKNSDSPSKKAANRAFDYYWDCKKALDKHFVQIVVGEENREWWDKLYRKCSKYHVTATSTLKKHRGCKEDFRYVLGIFLKVISFWGLAERIDKSTWFNPITDSMAVIGFFQNNLPKPKSQPALRGRNGLLVPQEQKEEKRDAQVIPNR